MNLLHAALLFGVLLMAASKPTFAAPLASAPTDRLLTDFRPSSADLGWFVVNDNVMGGRSQGDFAKAESALRFAGRTNTNGGGFSSIRTKPLNLDLSDRDGIRVRVKGDGRRYTWRLTTDARWRGRPVSYWADFETTKGAWTDARIPFALFKPQFRGYALKGLPLDPSRIRGMGLMIYDKRDGPFQLQLSSVHAYKVPAPFALSDYRSKNRLLVLCAPTAQDLDLKLQKTKALATQAAFAARDMILVVVVEDGGSKAGERSLTVAEADAVRGGLQLTSGTFNLRLVGKDGTVKHTASEAMSMKDLYALIDDMPMRRAEVSERAKR